MLASQLEKELLASRLIKTDATSHTHISPLGLIPKPGQPGKWRLIMDLSAPRGRSINDSIDLDLCSLKYATINQALLFLQILGPGAQLAKMDLKSAYRMVPVHPDDQHLLGLKWEGVVYRDTSLPFGLRSAPKIFSAVADSLAWAMTCNGATNFLHYLDDFLFMGPPTQTVVRNSLHYALSTCTQLKFPVATEKTVGPTQQLVFLGIEINNHRVTITTSRQAHTPEGSVKAMA